MTYQVAIIITTSKKEYPAGTVSVGIKVTLGELSQMMTANPVYFDNVAPGTYQITIQAVDPQGNGIGVMLSGSVTIEPESVLISTPDSFSVAVAPMNSWNAIADLNAVPNIDGVSP